MNSTRLLSVREEFMPSEEAERSIENHCSQSETWKQIPPRP